MEKILISEFMDEGTVEELRREFGVHYDPDLHERPKTLCAKIVDVAALIVRNRTQVDTVLLDCATQLRVIGRLGVGLDNIDVVDCERRGIRVCPATGANDVAVAEYVIAAALMLLRGCYCITPEIVRGGWPRQQSIGRELQDKMLGLIGLGNIARETARRGQLLGMTVVAYDPYLAIDDPVWRDARRMDLSAVLCASDVVSLHVPLNEATRGMIDAQAIAKMKSDALLVNTSRGGVVDERAVIEALKSGQLGGAALDVFAIEPVTDDYGQSFRDVPNLILTPHIAGVTRESNQRVSAATAANVRKVLHQS